MRSPSPGANPSMLRKQLEAARSAIEVILYKYNVQRSIVRILHHIEL